MIDNKRATTVLIISLAVVFVACLVFIVFHSSNTQTKNFWNNQQDKLALITQSCVTEISGWGSLHKTILNGLSLEVKSGRLISNNAFHSHLGKVANLSFDMLDIELTDFMEWYRLAQASSGEIIFSEPYVDT